MPAPTVLADHVPDKGSAPDAGPAWRPILAALPLPGQSAVVSAGGRRLLLAREAGGALRAVDLVCPHQGLAMEGARVRGAAIVCPHHGARFCLRTGRALGPPAFHGVGAWPVREHGGRAEVLV